MLSISLSESSTLFAKTWAILLAAGSGTRLSNASNGITKQYIIWKNKPLYWHSAITLSKIISLDGIVFVFPEKDCAAEKERIINLNHIDNLGIKWLIAAGGKTRQDSSRLGLEHVPLDCDKIIIHDAARPFVSPQLANQIIGEISIQKPAIIPAIPVTDTIKLTYENNPLKVEATLPRNRLMAAQTPQGFYCPALRNAHLEAKRNKIEATDDASLLEIFGYQTFIIPGETSNIKITNPQDLKYLLEKDKISMKSCVGFGYDVHKYGPGRPLKLGGIILPGEYEVIAHSDGDVLLHALMDALLGCAGLGDIGKHFPDSNAEYEGISSAILLDHVLDLLREIKMEICNIDMTIVAQRPKISPYESEIRKNIARLLNLRQEYVNLKATTEEGLGFTGRKEGIKAYVIVSGLRP